MRNHPSKAFSFPEYEKYRPNQRNQAARNPHPEARTRAGTIQRKKCKPFPERGINTNNLPPHSAVRDIIHQHRWDYFIREPAMYDAELVKEFYANMYPPVYHERYTVMVRGVAVRISLDDICNYHRVPRRPELGMSFGMTNHDAFTVSLSPVIAGSLRRTGVPDWVRTQNEVLKSELHTDLAFMMLFVKSSLKPSTHNTTADPQVAQVLYSLQHGLLMDVGHIIWMEILDAGMTLDGVLPFPCMITHFCQQAGIRTGQLTPTKKCFDISHYNIQIRAAADLDRRREVERRELDEDDDDSEDEYDFTVPDEEVPAEYHHTGDTPPWASNMMQHMMQQMNQGFSSLNARMDQAGIPPFQGEEQNRRRVRRRDTGGASSSRG